MTLLWNCEGDTYTAGQVAPAGHYVRIDSHPDVQVVLTEPGFLPASLDGHVAVYWRLDHRPYACPTDEHEQSSGAASIPPKESPSLQYSSDLKTLVTSGVT